MESLNAAPIDTDNDTFFVSIQHIFEQMTTKNIDNIIVKELPEF
jgi:hypothetical protein